MITLDTSALLALFLPDLHSSRVRAALALAGHLGVSDFAIAEASAVIAARTRAGEISVEAEAGLYAALDGWVARAADRIVLDAADGPLAVAILRQRALGLRTPDALHLAICQRTGSGLISYDIRQISAARELGIALVGD